MRVIGAIVSRKAATGRARVISFKRKNTYVTDPDELKSEFPPDGLVFAPTLAEKFMVDDLIEFQAVQPQYPGKSTDDSHILDRNGGCNFAGYEVIEVPFNVLAEGASVDLEQIDATEVRPHSEFYLQINQFLYGPFKKMEDCIQPVKEVFQIATEGLQIYDAGARRYLLSKPVGTVKCDTMDREQLGDWLKELLRTSGSLADLQAVRQAIQSNALTALDGVRLKRALKGLDGILLNHSALKTIAESLPQFKISYENALEKVYEEIAGPVQLKVRELEQEINGLVVQKQQASLVLEEELRLLETANRQLRVIESERDRLIGDIRVHALVNQPADAIGQALVKYEIQDFTADGKACLTLDEFIKAFKASLLAGKDELAKAGHTLLLLLKDYRCLLSVAIEPILQIARLSNNAKVILQQVEPDWLKYDALYENGLKQCWESAQSQPELIHFFIMEDLNLSSPECYAKPLNDLLAGIRKSLPGLSGAFPANLWIFGVPLAKNPGQEFGLPLLKTSFSHWGAVPVREGAWEFTADNPGLKLSLPVLIGHAEMAAPSPDDYFLKA